MGVGSAAQPPNVAQGSLLAAWPKSLSLSLPEPRIKVTSGGRCGRSAVPFVLAVVIVVLDGDPMSENVVVTLQNPVSRSLYDFRKRSTESASPVQSWTSSDEISPGPPLIQVRQTNELRILKASE